MPTAGQSCRCGARSSSSRRKNARLDAAYFLGLPTRCAVANINATVFMSLGWTLPAGMRRWVMSSSLMSKSTSAIESIRPDDTSGVFSSICSPGFLTSFTTWSIICCASGVTRRCLLWFDRQFRVLLEQLFARGGARRFSGGALYNPLRRFQQDRPHRDSHVAHNAAADFALDVVGLLKKLFALDLSDDNDIFGAKISIEHAERDGAAIVDCRVAADDLLDVLRIDVLAAYDEQVVLAADDIKFTIEIKTKIAGVIPAVAKDFFGEVRTIVVSLKQRVALDGDLSHVTVLQHLAGIRNNLHTIAGQQLPRGGEGNSARVSFQHRRDDVLGAETLSVGPDNLRSRLAANARLGDREDILRHGIGGLQCRSSQPMRRERGEKFVHTGSAHRLRAIDQRARR